MSELVRAKQGYEGMNVRELIEHLQDLIKQDKINPDTKLVVATDDGDEPVNCIEWSNWKPQQLLLNSLYEEEF